MTYTYYADLHHIRHTCVTDISIPLTRNSTLTTCTAVTPMIPTTCVTHVSRTIRCHWQGTAHSPHALQLIRYYSKWTSHSQHASQSPRWYPQKKHTHHMCHDHFDDSQTEHYTMHTRHTHYFEVVHKEHHTHHMCHDHCKRHTHHHTYYSYSDDYQLLEFNEKNIFERLWRTTFFKNQLKLRSLNQMI